MNATRRSFHQDDACIAGADVNKPDWTVRIVAVPPGEAPLWVREKWVGLDLPVARYSGRGKFITLGVLSLPRSMLAQCLAVFRGRAERTAVTRWKRFRPSASSPRQVPKRLHGGAKTRRI
jgi:hypothetical protein